MPACPRRNTRSRPSTRKAPACRRTWNGRCGCSRRATLTDNVDAEVEYAIALFNGTGTPKNQPAAVALLRKAARQGSAIAQNRLAWVLINGMGTAVDKVEGFKWHLVAKTAGKGDPELDKQLSDLPAEDRAKAEAAARKWLGPK